MIDIEKVAAIIGVVRRAVNHRPGRDRRHVIPYYESKVDPVIILGAVTMGAATISVAPVDSVLYTTGPWELKRGRSQR